MNALKIAEGLIRDLEPLRFKPPVAYIYNPLIYAWPGHRQYLERYGKARREIVFIGMNPGPWGMAQTGVPFGEVGLVRDWLGISGAIGKPQPEHPKRPVLGFECTRSEVSGLRLWGWIRKRFKTPERFFSRFFVANYCPLLFMEASGRNLTPDKLSAKEREPLLRICDLALQRLIEHFKPSYVIGVGGFAEMRAQAALRGVDVRIGKILHPSPASPAANKNWSRDAEAMLKSQGIQF